LVSVSSTDLESVGEEIEISPPSDGVTRIVMKFGGSSLASPERITYVSKLIKKHVEQGYSPIIICSAMGKTTNTLLSAGDFALQGQVIVESLRTMHLGTAAALGLPESTTVSLNKLIDSLERLLEGISYIGELTPRTIDALISFGERMSIRIIAANLNRLGVPAQPFDSWTLGLRTSSEFGNAEVSEHRWRIRLLNIFGYADILYSSVFIQPGDHPGQVTSLVHIVSLGYKIYQISYT